MRDATGEWVDPIIDAWNEKFPESNIGDVMMRTAIANERIPEDLREAISGKNVIVASVDWIQVGRLLLADLDWTDYPDTPLCDNCHERAKRRREGNGHRN